MSIKCGRCEGRHESVEDVRECYNGGSPATISERVPSALRATAKQAAFISSLLSKRHMVAEPAPDELERRVASWLIDHLLGKGNLPAGVTLGPDPAWQSADGDRAGHGGPGMRTGVAASDASAQTQAALPDVAAGHYAVASATGSNDLDFYRVDRPTEGRWAGYTFVKRVIGGHPDQRLNWTQRRAALEQISAAGAAQAAMLYGQELGRCCRCNRHLTDETSRQLGIGPECRSKVA